MIKKILIALFVINTFLFTIASDKKNIDKKQSQINSKNLLSIATGIQIYGLQELIAQYACEWQLVNTKECRDFSVCVKYSNNDNHLVYGSINGTISILDSRTLELLHKLKGHKGQINSLTYSCDNKFLATSTENAIKIWDVYSNKKVHTINRCDICNLSFSKNNKYLISTHSFNDKYIIHIRDANNDYKNIESFLSDCFGSFSHDDKYFITSLDNSLIFLDTETWKNFKTIPLENNDSKNFISFSSDNKYLALASKKSLKILNANTFELLHKISNFKGDIYFLKYSPDNKYLVSCSHENDNLKIWDAKTYNLLQILDSEKIDFSNDNKYFASTGKDGSIQIWYNQINDLLNNVGNSDLINSKKQM